MSEKWEGRKLMGKEREKRGVELLVGVDGIGEKIVWV